MKSCRPNDNTTMSYAEVTLSLKVGKNSSLTYQVPSEMEHELEIGAIVKIPLRNKTTVGIVTKRHEHPLDFETKAILEIKNHAGNLKPWQIELAQWIADYYMAPLYKVLKLMIPKGAWKLNPKIPRKLTKKNIGIKTTEIAESKPVEKQLTEDQVEVIKGILNSNKKEFFIHGITGSGKTEIYLRLAQETIRKGQKVILLVPEISLTPQLIQYFRSDFGAELAVVHSRLSPGKREREWWRIQKSEAKLVIGSRSALFAPVKNLGMIIVDEEHEWSYKQDQNPRYHARDVAFKMSTLTGCKVVLGSATPSLESYHALKTEKIKGFRLQHRVHPDQKLPIIHMVDLREELRAGNFSIFSDLLIEKLKTTIAQNKQAILFLNRRGHASALTCRECGKTAGCRDCDVSLTYHRFGNGLERLICHYCGFTEKVPTCCPNCKGMAIKTVGIGTQQIESELQKRFPTLRILRADKDTTRTKDSFKTLYHAFKAGKADVLIGTQMIGKGLDLPNVTLVGVILADVGLHLPDFRATERNFQLMTQVAGRAGRAEHPGEVVIQTYNPEHSSLKYASTHDTIGFCEKELLHRQELSYPPFKKIIKLTHKHIDQKICSISAQTLTEKLKIIADKEYEITCAPAVIPRQYNKYHWHVFLSGSNPQEILKKHLKKEPLDEHWSIDVDPLMML